MSLASRLALATFGYRGGYSGTATAETRYVVQEVQILEMKDILNSNISVEVISCDTSVQQLFADMD